MDKSLYSNDLVSKLAEIDYNISVDTLVDQYNDMLTTLSNIHCPLVEKNIIIRDDSPWCNGSVIAKRRLRRTAERKWRRTKCAIDRVEYEKTRKSVVDEVSLAKSQYYNEKIETNSGNKRLLWSLMNDLLGRTKQCIYPSYESPTELATKFNVFFLEKIAQIRQNIDSINLTDNYSEKFVNYVPVYNLGSFTEFELLSDSAVKSCFESVNKTCCLLDPINIKKVSFSCSHLLPLIKEIINKCFSEGQFPISEKRAVVRPLLKKPGTDKEVLKNYRPVSNLSFLSKVIEKAILLQLLPFLESKAVIPKFQSAYRELHSTETALCRIYNDLVENCCLGQTSLLILLDLSAAFDTIDHDMFIQDLIDFGVSGSAISVIKSYLIGRSQCISIDAAISDFSELEYGVPQGSILGPILFTIYVSGLSNLLKSHGVDFHLYADDTQIYIPVSNINNTKNDVTALLSDIKIWMNKRKLKLNEGKTEIILLKGSMRKDITPSFGNLTFGDTDLIPCSSVRNIGVHFDSNLSFDKHINTVVKECNFQIRNLYLIRKFLTRDNLMSLVHAFILCKIDYCNSLFIGLPKKQLKKLQKVQNRAVRLVCSLKISDHITPFLIQLHWLPIKARIEFKICLLVFKILKFGQPKYLYELIDLSSSNELEINLRSNDDPFRLEEPRSVRNQLFGDRSFKYIAPRLYNLLPFEVKKLESVDLFKKKLKTYFFTKAFDLNNLCISLNYAV